MLLNEKPLNFTICQNTKLEGAISGPDRAPILQAEIWARSGRAFHYWSGARQISLSGPHVSRSGPDRRPTKISTREPLKKSTFFNFSQFIIQVNLHRLLAGYQKYFDRFFLDIIIVKI